MNFLELVKNRYSCRAYKSLSVEREKLDYILECVRLAPSAVNKQPWRFHIVSKEEDKALLQQCYNRDWFKTAPMYVIASILHDEEWVRSDGATCWVCNFDAALCKQLFGLPANEEPAVVIPLGYADDNPKEKKRKPIEDIIR